MDEVAWIFHTMDLGRGMTWVLFDCRTHKFVTDVNNATRHFPSEAHAIAAAKTLLKNKKFNKVLEELPPWI